MKIRAACPEHGEWHPDLKDRKSRSACPVGDCTAGAEGKRFRYIPKAADFRQPEPEPAPEPEPDNSARLAAVDAATMPLHPALRSMTRLMLSAAAARYHLRQARPRGHLSGIAAGPTQRGKTLVAVIICKALGVDEVTGIRLAAKETELSLWGRRIQEPGGRYVLAPAPVLALPFAALDELDKATGPLLKAALRLLQGDARVDAEGQAVDVAPAAYATSNAGLTVLPESYRRRSACLNATRLPELSYATARQVVAAVPQLPLARLAPPAAELPAEVLGRMEGALRAALTGGGWVLCDLQALELAVLGRAGLTGGGTLGDAALHTVVDYLELAATTGEAHPDWTTRLHAWASGRPAAPARGRNGAEAEDPAPEDPADAYLRQAEAVGMAGVIAHRLARAVDDLGDAARMDGIPAGMLDEAAGIRQMAKQLLGPDLRKIRDTARLAVVLPAAEHVTRLAEDLAAAMRAAAGDTIAGEYEDAHMAALQAEAARRLQLASREPEPAEHPSQPAVDLPPGYLQRLGRPRPPGPVPPGRFRLRTTMRAPALVQAAPALMAAPGTSVTEMLAAASAARIIAPARDTTAAETIQKETRRREAAGLPPPPADWMMRVALGPPPAPPPAPAPARRCRFRRKPR